MCIFKGLDILRFWWGFFFYSVVLKGPVFVVRIFYLSHFFNSQKSFLTLFFIATVIYS